MAKKTTPPKRGQAGYKTQAEKKLEYQRKGLLAAKPETLKKAYPATLAEYEKKIIETEFGTKYTKKDGTLSVNGIKKLAEMPNLDAKAYEHYQKELLSAKELERQATQFDKAGKTPAILVEKVAKIKGGNVSIGTDIITTALKQKNKAAQNLYTNVDFKNSFVTQVANAWDMSNIDLSKNPLSTNGVKNPDMVLFETSSIQIIDRMFAVTDTTAIAAHLKLIASLMGSEHQATIEQVVNKDLTSDWKVTII